APGEDENDDDGSFDDGDTFHASPAGADGAEPLIPTYGDDEDVILEQERLQVDQIGERTILVACLLPEAQYDEQDPLGELTSLAETAGAIVVGEMVQRRRKPDVATYLGTGKLEELKLMKEELQAKLVVFDNDLTPSQIRNIEKIVQCKILDRSELILDIFAGRATTAAAKLQVELAQLEYTYPRLRAMWSHFGQIAGGAPIGIGTRGPGETQIEIDRRIVQRRKALLKNRLAEINARRRREVERRASENFTVCLVGYTNAGKSTLFNALTEPHGGGGAYADDRLFATLTTRTRAWPLGSGDSAMLSDTVGFVRDLPHHLIASFKATLEEALHADLLLIVIDVADPLAEHHYDVVMRTLDVLVDEDAGSGRADRSTSRRSDADSGSSSDDDNAAGGRNGSMSRSRKNASAAPFADGPVVAGGDRWRSPAPVEGEPPPLENELNPPKPDWPHEVEKSDEDQDPPRLLVLNKVDRLQDEAQLAVWHRRDPNAVAVSAVAGRGLEELKTRVQDLFQGHMRELEILVPLKLGKAIAFIESRCDVTGRDYDTEFARFRARVPDVHLPQLRSMGLQITEVSSPSK
ncbi:MAG: GTPase HflX, partial [Planctomycetota bacterium]